MLQIQFTAEEIEALHYERLHHPDPRVQQRCEIVYLKAMGVSHQEIGRLARVSQPTVRRYLAAYQAGGLDQLKVVNVNRPTSELNKYRTTLKEEFEARPPTTLQAAAERIATLTGIRRSPTQVRQFLLSLGLKRRKVGQVPAKADPAQQAKFLEQQLQPRLEEARPGQRHVMFVDAAHFVLQPFLGFVWCLARIFKPPAVGSGSMSWGRSRRPPTNCSRWSTTTMSTPRRL